MDQQQDLKQVNKKVKDYLLTKLLGYGSFAKVYEAIHAQTNKSYAIKMIQKKTMKMQPKVAELFNTECNVLKKIQHPNVVAFIERFDSSNNCYLVLEFCNGGDMQQYLDSKKRIPEGEAIEYFLQILNGFKALHEHNVIHRDLKLANILRHDNLLKIADLGFAKELKNAQDVAKTILGTSLTMAPEVLEGHKYGLEADIYSLGVILYQMLFGEYPHSNAANDQELAQKIKNNKLHLKRKDVKLSPEVIDLLSKLLIFDSQDRITWNQLYQHSVLQKKDGLLDSMKPISRYGLFESQIYKNQKFYQEIEYKAIPEESKERNKDHNVPTLGINSQQVSQSDYEQFYKDSPSNQKIIYQQQYLEEEDVQDIEADSIRKQNEKNKKLQSDNLIVIEMYLNEINIYGILARALKDVHTLPPTKLNTFLPCFLIVKKLLAMNNTLLEVITQKKNIFFCENLNILVQLEQFKLIEKQVQEDQTIIKLYHITLSQEVNNIFNKMTQPNKDVIQELNLDDKLGDNFNQLFMEVLMNYYFNLQDEKEQQTNEENRSKIQMHQLAIMDCLTLEKVFKKQQSQQLFNFVEYNILIKSMSEKEIDQLIEERFLTLYNQ